MSDSPPPPPPPQPPMLQQAFQGILARNITNNYVSVPVHYHQPTGTRYIPMSVLRHLYPGIVRLQVGGQEIQPRRGLPTVEAIFEGVLSQWAGEATMASDEGDGGAVGDLSTPEVENGSAQSSYVLVAQVGDRGVAEGGGSQGSHVSTTTFFPNNSINSALLSQPGSRALSDEGASENNIEWIEYRPDSIVQVIYSTPGPITEITATGSTQSKGKDRKRDRDEDDYEDSSPSACGSEKRLRSSSTSPNGEDEEEDDDETDSQKLANPASSGSGSGSGSDPESDPSYRPGSGSYSNSESGSSSAGSPSSSSSGSGAPSSNGSGSSSASGSSAGPSSKGLSESSSIPESSSLQLSVTSGSGTTISSSLETSPSALLGEAEMPADQSPSDELNQEDVIMLTSEAGASMPEKNTNERESSRDSDGDDDIDDEEDNTQPFRFTNNQLREFVAKRKGLLVGETQAVTIALKSNKEARQFYKFLTSQDYFGRWLNIRLTWNWDRNELGLLVQALTDSPIETLLLDGYCDHAAVVASDATVPDTKCSIFTLPSAPPGLGRQSMDNRTRTRRYDPLIRLFRNNRFRELHFYGLPNLLQHSIAPVPWALSHIRSFHLHANINSWEGVQALRFLQFVKRATNLEHLRVDCPTDQYHIYTDKIERALNESERNKDSPPLDIHFQHHQRRHTLLRVKYDQWDREVKEFEVDLIGASSEFNIAWNLVLEQFVNGTLASLAFNNMPDERWMGVVMDWVNTQMNNRGLGLRNLRLDCLQFGPTQFHDLIKLLELTQPHLQTLDLRNVYMSFPPRSNSPSPTTTESATMLDRDQDLTNNASASIPMITWPTMIKSLNFSVLVSLRIKTSNLQDRDIDGVVECLRTMALGSKKLDLKKLLLQGAQLSVHGERTLVKEVEAFLPGVDVKFR
ncbi:MAG: hypothetical protein J3R72DRAFT_473086 [Linnemannia gamsii]|nr:MAG: hypothetical protein J3R72DRAFT_473086 [Linnemannia gamsii]